MFAGAKLNLHLTEHVNGLPASYRLSSVNPEKPAASFIRDDSEGTEEEVRPLMRCRWQR